MEQLKKKARQLEVAAAVCKVNAEEMLEDIAVSVETTNKLTESLHSQEETTNPYLQWWDVFLKEWSYKCSIRWLRKYGDSKDYQRMQNLWFGFEILWVVGCDMVRITRLNELREGISGVIVRESPSKTDIEKIWRWHDESTNQKRNGILRFLHQNYFSLNILLQELTILLISVIASRERPEAARISARARSPSMSSLRPSGIASEVMAANSLLSAARSSPR